jgi:transcriptional antiterminator NusG
MSTSESTDQRPPDERPNVDLPEEAVAAPVGMSAPSDDGREAAELAGHDDAVPADGITADGITADGITADGEEDDDGTPAVLEDPFAGDENAKPVEMSAEVEVEQPVGDMQWYILKVQSNREDSIREALMRRVSLQGMERFFGDVVVPKEQVTEFKGGKKRVVWRKLYPGYILVNMLLNDETWYLVRETGGIGDFTGSAGRPSPMLPQDVAKLLRKDEEKAAEAPRLKINFKKGDRVKINEGTFENFEGEVDQIDEANGRVTVMLSIFGRSTPVDIEYWQIESV